MHHVHIAEASGWIRTRSAPPVGAQITLFRHNHTHSLIVGEAPLEVCLREVSRGNVILYGWVVSKGTKWSSVAPNNEVYSKTRPT